MCYMRSDRSFEAEEVHRLRTEKDRRRRAQSEERASEKRSKEKPLTEKVKEMVGAR